MAKENLTNIIDLNRSLREKENEIELLQQTFTEIGSELDLDNVFEIVSERARELINAETLLIPLLDDNGETYTYRSGSGKDAAEVVGTTLPLDFGICGWVWEHKKPWWNGILNNLSESERAIWYKQIGNTILVPLQGKRQFLGGISGLSKVGGGSFDRKDLNLLQLFAGIVSIAIENAMAVKAMEKTHRLNEEYRFKLESLNRKLVDSSKKLEYLSLYDSITALPNRTLFYDRLARDISAAEFKNASIALLLIDVDNFKEVNDALGHDRGDDLLHKIARRLEKVTRNNETLARLGADEFIVIMPEHDQEKAVIRAEQYGNALNEAIKIGHNSIDVNISSGVAVYPEHGTKITSLLSHVDFALYEAKNSVNRVCVYNPDNDYLAQRQQAMVADVREALNSRQFELYYQPKISAQTGKVVGAEALVRWHSEKNGTVPPDTFIPVLEQNSMIDEYTCWAIETALAQAREWQDRFHKIRIAVNLSPQTLMQANFIAYINKLIKNEDDGSLLTFEITENLFLSEFEHLEESLDYLCSLGIDLSIDDYGTGYSSLGRLRRLPVSELKIDKSFIRDMVENRDDQAVVHSTIELAHNLGLRVVAEGVESQAVYDLLAQFGCDTIQGYFLSVPLPRRKFSEFVSSRQDAGAAPN